MKHIIYKAFAIGALLLGLGSCADTWEPADTSKQGSLELSTLDIDMRNSETVITDAGSRASVTNFDDFIITITDNSGEAPTRKYRYADMPEVLTLPEGDAYEILVESHAVQKAEWDKPYYKGSKTFTITAGKITQIGAVECRFASLKVSVKFADDLMAMLGEDVKVVVKSNDAGELTFTKNETRSGFYEVVDNSTTMSAHFEGSIDGVWTEKDTPFPDIAAGQHRIITYSVKATPDIPEQSGQIDPSDGGIILDADVSTGEVSGDTQVDEDLIDGSDRPGQEQPTEPDEPDDPAGPDDPTDTPAATFEATDSPKLSLDAVNIVTGDFGNAIVTIKCEKGIQHLFVAIDTDSDNFLAALSDLGLDKPFDLAYPGDLEGSVGEDGLGLATGDKVINQTEVPFNITQFVPMLGGFPGNHNFTLTVTDNDGNEAKLVLKFKAN